MAGIQFISENSVLMYTAPQIKMACPQFFLGISQQTFYRWEKKYGDTGVAKLRRLKSLEEENRRLMGGAGTGWLSWFSYRTD